ncbi:cytochrome o ubiquinol oxidase subunit IV [Oceanimonas pelagia]|uniref:Cytochrome bo(3) ubiquinol oxidase subunit 4 n=1 Tax=Oceanimonas pelagia TaxID=3028314 RepID=A0AA50Q7M3_9GAMM|nr:cytochrome o ubiquinol oxidase subunit IV [Oceanimonas pelagia]WMC10705.1 cytochrome o ubiquinol oxidase subunit IV [Oceanimonas pelagia]
MSHNHDAVDHGSVKSYLTGFVLSVILTAIPFWAVMTGELSPGATLGTVVLLAIVQIVVHLKYFLHLSFKPGSRENTVAFLFSALIIVMVVGLSVWIILSSNEMMMY